MHGSVCSPLLLHAYINHGVVNRIDTFANITEDAQVSMDGLTQWQELKTGPYVNALVDFIGFVRLQESLVPKPDPAAGPHSPHYEFAVSVRYYDPV